MKQFDLNDETFLARWLADSLSDEELHAFESHPDYFKYQKIKDVSSLLYLPQLDRDQMLEKVKSSRTNHKLDKDKAYTSWRTIFAVAASVVVLLGFLWFTYMAPSTLTAPQGERMMVALPDGSQMWLNSASTAKFNKYNWEDNRLVKLEGEAYFRVKKGKKFTVRTPKGEVHVLGTQFEVQSLTDLFIVNCFEGKVRVESKEQNTILAPGEGIVKINNNTFRNETITLPQPEWIEKSSVSYTNVPLTVAVAALKKHFGLQIENVERIPSTLRYTGRFSTTELETAVKSVFGPIAIPYKLSDDKKTLTLQ